MKIRFNLTLQRSNAPTLQRSNAPTLQRSNAPTLQRSNAPTLQRSNAPTRNSRYLEVLFLILYLTSTNFVQAQPTLCQQIGENFVPNITIGINESSVTTTSGLLGIAG